MANSFLDPIQRGGVRPSIGGFKKRDNYTNNNSSNFNRPPQTFQSLDGRNFERKDQMFNANKEYYQKMLNESKGNYNK